MTTLADDLQGLLDRPLPKQRILFFDIETAPALAFIWQARTDYIGSHMIEHETFMLSWAAKWEDESRVLSGVVTSTEAKEQNDSRVVAELAELIREADIVVAHNVDRFDIPMLNNRLLLLELTPLGPVKTIDTLKLAKRSFRLLSNKLDWLAQQLGFGNKISTDFELWRRCYGGESKALKEMLRYNKKDVVLLQQVYETMKPYSKGLPRVVDGDGRRGAFCPHCGSSNLELQDKPYRTNASSFPVYLCECGLSSRSRSSDPARKMDLHPL